MLQLMVLLSLASIVNSQQSSNNSLSTPQNNTSSSCDPTVSVCPNANCDSNTQSVYFISVKSPNNSVFFYTGNPIFVNWYEVGLFTICLDWLRYLFISLTQPSIIHMTNSSIYFG